MTGRVPPVAAADVTVAEKDVLKEVCSNSTSNNTNTVGIPHSLACGLYMDVSVTGACLAWLGRQQVAAAQVKQVERAMLNTGLDKSCAGAIYMQCNFLASNTRATTHPIKQVQASRCDGVDDAWPTPQCGHHPCCEVNAPHSMVRTIRNIQHGRVGGLVTGP